MELKIGKKSYRVKFGYKALAKSDVLNDVATISEKLNDDTTLKDIADILDITANLLLAGLQKFHKEEFGVDYDNAKSIDVALDRVYDLLDTYSEDDEENDVMDLFGKLVNELMDNGFFKKLSNRTQELMEETDSTVAPKDHQKKKA